MTNKTQPHLISECYSFQVQVTSAAPVHVHVESVVSEAIHVDVAEDVDDREFDRNVLDIFDIL